MKPSKILFILLLALVLTACALPTVTPTPTPPPSHTPIPPTVTPSPAPPTVTATLSPVPSNTPTATPIPPTATPTDNPYLSTRCLQVSAGLPPDASLAGVLAFQPNSVIDGEPAFLLDLGSGERTVLEPAAHEIRSRYSVSTGGHWLSFVSTLRDDQGAFRGRSLVVLDARGQQQAVIPLSEYQSTIYPRGSVWLDDQRTLIWPEYNVSADYSPNWGEDPGFQLHVINPFANQSTTIDMVDAWGFYIFAGDDTHWDVPVVPDPILRWVAYPGYITSTTGAENSYDVGLLLWDRQSGNGPGTLLARYNNYHFPPAGPKWSPDGMRLAFTSESSGGEELVIVDREGQVLHQTRLGEAYEQVTIMEYSWSPDGSQIAFWMIYPHEPSPGTWRAREETLALLDVASGQVTNLCISMDSGLAFKPLPVWSPDGRYLVVSSYDGETQSVVLIDLISNDASVILNENVQPRGWMVNPGE